MNATPSMTDLKQLLERLEAVRVARVEFGQAGDDDKIIEVSDELCTEAAQAILILSEENRRLREALEPFGDVDGEGDEDYPDSLKVVAKFGRCTDYCLTLGDFRRARTALHAEGERE
jgi:hypothetical protein